MHMDSKRVKEIIMIQSAIFLMSFSGVFSKIASRFDFLSFKFLVFYGASLAVLGIYAVVWQQILRRVDLTTAFSNRALSVVWSMLWGIVLFHEVLTFKMVFGAIIIMIGIMLVVTSNE